MSYQQGQQGYGQYNPYAQQGGNSDPPSRYTTNESSYGYDDRQQTNPQQNYSQQGYGQQTGAASYNQASNAEQGAGRYEMTNMNGSDPNRILNECFAVDQSVDDIEKDLKRLEGLRSSLLKDAGASNSGLVKEIDRVTEDIMSKYRALVNKVVRIRQNPESRTPRNAPQVGKADRRVKTALNLFQQQEREHRQKQEEMFTRQYLIVRPDASEAEIREARESEDPQVFSQALINMDRRGEAQKTRGAVQQRHLAIQKIERDMMTLAQMFQDLEVVVLQAEPAVQRIEETGETVHQDVVGANVQLNTAVKSARAARRKKFYCLGICVLIVIIIAAILGGYFGTKH